VIGFSSTETTRVNTKKKKKKKEGVYDGAAGDSTHLGNASLDVYRATAVVPPLLM
jgi:hypothetical protein